MFIVGCQDQSTAVSVAAMAATANYINAISDEPEVMQLQCVLTPMLGVMHACLQRGTEQSLYMTILEMHNLLTLLQHIMCTQLYFDR